MDSRNARRMMQRMGMQMEEIKGVTTVTIRAASKEIQIESPSVTVINVQGQRVYQVAGGRYMERVPQPTQAQIVMEEEKKEVQIPEEDALLVAQQAGVNLEKARDTLKKVNGDLARAIIILQTG